jgi:uncharacterized protein YkwD
VGMAALLALHSLQKTKSFAQIMLIKNCRRLLIALLFYSTAFSQSVWRHRDYETTTHKNFRHNQLFSQTIAFDQIDYPLLHAAIFFVTNETRVKNDRKPLAFAIELERAAYHHSKRMVEQDFFGHENPHDKKRKTTEQRARLAGIKNPFLAENIALHFGIRYVANTPVYPVDPLNGTFSYESDNDPLIPAHTYLSFAEALVKQWMDSPGHRQNILNPRALQLGCGVYFYRDRTFYNMPKFKATQNFQLYREIVSGKATDWWP